MVSQIDTLPNLVEKCFTSTHLLFKGKFFEHATGTPKGFPLSSVFANIFMEALEKEALGSTDIKPKLWLRYVDDSYII